MASRHLLYVFAAAICVGIFLFRVNVSIQDTLDYALPDKDLTRVFVDWGIVVGVFVSVLFIGTRDWKWLIVLMQAPHEVITESVAAVKAKPATANVLDAVRLKQSPRPTPHQEYPPPRRSLRSSSTSRV